MTRPRTPDGRFLPSDGTLELPPRPKAGRDEHGRFIPGERIQSSKPYSRAVRDLLEAPKGSIPDGWDLKNLTGAQELAMVHLAQAQAGNHQIGLMLVDRAEGKVPQAAEDREAAREAGAGVRALMDLLGLKSLEPIDAEVIEDAQESRESCNEAQKTIEGQQEAGEVQQDGSESPS